MFPFSFVRRLLLSLVLLFVGLVGARAELELPLHPDELAVVRRLVERGGRAASVQAPPSFTQDSVRRELTALGVDAASLRFAGIVIAERPREFLAFAHDPAGRVLAIRGNGPWLTNETLADFVHLPELRLISVDHNGATGKQAAGDPYSGAGLAALADSKVVSVKLGLSFSDEGLAAAAKIRGLRVLHVFHSRATEAGIDALAGHPGLVEFSIGEMASNRVTPAALAKIARIPGLKRVGFKECVVAYEGGLDHLKALPGPLEEIDLSMCLVTAADLARLQADHPAAKIKTMTPDAIARNHRGVAANLARQAPPELAEPLRAALAKLGPEGAK